jgi:hypothetical protein
VLSPADLGQPLPLVKMQLNAALDQAQAQAQIQINRDRAAMPPAPAIAALPEVLRNSLACLLFACGYAAFARRTGSDLSLLQEIQKSLQRLQPLRPRRAGSQGDEVRQLSGREE